MPVVEDDLALVGIVSRQDVMKAMQLDANTNCRYNFRSNFREVMPEENGKETTRFRFRLRPKWLTVLVPSRLVSK